MVFILHKIFANNFQIPELCFTKESVWILSLQGNSYYKTQDNIK